MALLNLHDSEGEELCLSFTCVEKSKKPSASTVSSLVEVKSNDFLENIEVIFFKSTSSVVRTTFQHLGVLPRIRKVRCFKMAFSKGQICCNSCGMEKDSERVGQVEPSFLNSYTLV